MVQVWKSVGKLSQQGVVLGMPFCLSQFFTVITLSMRNHAVPCEAKFRPKGLSLFIENALLLPPANQVWSKVIFSEASVICSQMWEGICLLGMWGGGCLLGRGLCIQGLGVCIQRARGLHLGGGSTPRGWESVSGGVGRPLFRNKKKCSVRILLECCLVIENNPKARRILAYPHPVCRKDRHSISFCRNLFFDFFY